MNKQELVRTEMIKAMKEKDKPKKETLSMLLAALKNAEIDKMRVLSPRRRGCSSTERDQTDKRNIGNDTG